jgi:hypothetical protein
MPDEAPLREFARLAIRKGTLPRRDAARIWAGPGLGAFCSVCEKPVTQDQLEYELEFAQDGDPSLNKLHFHLRCFAVWELERTKVAP